MDWVFELLRLRGDDYEIIESAASRICQWDPEYWRDPQELDEMFIVSIIKEFNVTREEMEALIEVEKGVMEEFGTDKKMNKEELFELPNLDIIYTLDNEIINEYYLYG